MQENTGQSFNHEESYEHKKMLHTLKSGKPLLRRGVFYRIFDLLGFRPFGKMAVEVTKCPDSIYDRSIHFGYMHLSSMMNKMFKDAFDRYLVDYKIRAIRTRDTKGKITNYGDIAIYFKWSNIQWGLMDFDLMQKYPNAVKVDNRGCVSFDAYKRKKLKFKSIRTLVTSNTEYIRWEDIGNEVAQSTKESEPVVTNEFVYLNSLSYKGILHSDFEDMGIDLLSTYPDRIEGKKMFKFEVKDLDKWNAAVLKYNLQPIK